ncbi:hypothetical protein D3C72_1183150 [compost metagenome]
MILLKLSNIFSVTLSPNQSYIRVTESRLKYIHHSHPAAWLIILIVYLYHLLSSFIDLSKLLLRIGHLGGTGCGFLTADNLLDELFTQVIIVLPAKDHLVRAWHGFLYTPS